ncbi:hypothetical protein [Tsukamurella tyrosinosolvens]|uniref:hypothetical protein n=1 Tax=Tsukamurella tyrosinosolvens TaxID=57704 RepID=UPI0012E7F618|nr:hypothetical protein [Tsukamurella tyrosinosolvens]
MVRHSGTYDDPTAVAREAISRAAGLGIPLTISERYVAARVAGGVRRLGLQFRSPTVAIELDWA